MKVLKNRGKLIMSGYFLLFACAFIMALFAIIFKNDNKIIDLPGNYAIAHKSALDIVLTKRSKDGSGYSDIIGAFVSDFAYDDNYIFVKRVDAPEYYRPVDRNNADYYCVIVASGRKIGPLSRDDFAVLLEELMGIEEYELEWIRTVA